MSTAMINAVRKMKVLWLFSFWVLTSLLTGHLKLICLFLIGVMLFMDSLWLLLDLLLCWILWIFVLVYDLVMEFISCTGVLGTESYVLGHWNSTMVTQIVKMFLFISIEESLTSTSFFWHAPKEKATKYSTVLCLVWV